MEWYTIICLLFGGMVLLILTGIPIAFAFLIINIAAAYFFLGGVPGLIGVTTSMFTSITTFTLLPVPFFILMGELIFHSNLGLDAVNVLDKWLGNLRGRLSLLAVIMGGSSWARSVGPRSQRAPFSERSCFLKCWRKGTAKT